MCTIVVIDANVFGIFLDGSELSALRSWITNGHGVVAYATGGRYAQELQRSSRMLELFGEYRRAQRVKLIDAKAIRKVEDTLDESTMQSNDRHVIALAKAGDALILCSKDQALHKDFLDVELLPNVNGQRRAVYPMNQKEGVHNRFLHRRRCPKRQEMKPKT